MVDKLIDKLNTLNDDDDWFLYNNKFWSGVEKQSNIGGLEIH